jgi:hypothetical protein
MHSRGFMTPDQAVDEDLFRPSAIRYSTRSAMIGSTEAARRAGM